VNPNHEKNHEKTGHRWQSLLVSRVARKVPNVRHLDLDLYQYCEKCKSIEVMIENEGVDSIQNVAFKNSEMTRYISMSMRDPVPVMLVQHTEYDVRLSVWVDDIYTSEPQFVMSGGWDLLEKTLNRFHEMHECQ